MNIHFEWIDSGKVVGVSTHTSRALGQRVLVEWRRIESVGESFLFESSQLLNVYACRYRFYVLLRVY